MSALFDAFTWWPWPQDRGPIRNVHHEPEAPGLVTLTWRTDTPCPTRLERPDGTHLYRNDAPSTTHQVTLTGGAGFTEEIEIHAQEGRQTIEVRF